MLVLLAAFLLAAPQAATEPAASPTVELARDTPVSIRIAEPISSKTSRPDDRFAIELAEPLMVDGQVIVPAGARGVGEVVHAAKARWGGKAGELIIAARFLNCGAVQLPLSRFRWSETGESRDGAALAASIAFTPAAFLIKGGEVEVPSGARATARLSAAVTLPAAGAPACPAP